ncbi:HAD-IA family hydrolase [Pseudocalidococcus azoricus]|nr:HAD-IA family hydrolase [Pseudocalidococcus azoricus]
MVGIGKNQRPEAIFLDAVGTLFGIRGNVGEIYGNFAAQAGVIVDSTQLDQAFMISFSQAPKLNSSLAMGEELVALERAWWESVAAKSFAAVGALGEFPNFSAFFQTLFDHFALADPWYVYEDVQQVLASWQQMGIRLGVLSNFDSRLYPVLEALKLADFFDSVTISTHVGAAKPDPDIFKIALEHYDLEPIQAWHIGDSWSEDVVGAERAGLGAIWLNRTGKSTPRPGVAFKVVTRLTELSL